VITPVEIQNETTSLLQGNQYFHQLAPPPFSTARQKHGKYDMETRNVLDIKQYILLSYDDSISFTMTQNESPSTIAAQPYFHQLAPQSLLHSAKSSCLSGALGSLNKPSLCYHGARIAYLFSIGLY